MTRSSISVIIPAYNAEKYLGETLQSIIDQTVPPDEILVVDDGSTDGTAELIQSFPATIRYLYQENAGQSAAVQKGIAESEGDLLAFLDSDDLWVPDKLEMQVQIMEHDPDTSIVLGHLQRFWVDEQGQPQFLAAELGFTFISALIRRAAFKAAGPFPTTTHGVEMEWLLQARDHGIPMHIHDEVVAYYRRHGENRTTTDGHDLRKALMGMIKRSLDRRREMQNHTGDGLES